MSTQKRKKACRLIYVSLTSLLVFTQCAQCAVSLHCHDFFILSSEQFFYLLNLLVMNLLKDA